MDSQTLFRSFRLNGRAPHLSDLDLYARVFGTVEGASRLAAYLQDWDRYLVSPWVMFHADYPVGVAGFRIGFGGEGLELSFHFLPEVAGQGLASEFVQAALDQAASLYREDQFFAMVSLDNAASIRVLEKVGFVGDPPAGGQRRMRLTLTPRAGQDRAVPSV